jgi:hypothetical protein
MSENDFRSRLESAIDRGRRRGEARDSARKAAEMTEEERRRLHTKFRLEMSESIEKAIHEVADHFPGFRTESLFGEIGWGSAAYRDDLSLSAGRRENRYSRLEMVIRPYSEVGVLDLKAKGTVSNREVFNRAHFVPVSEVDPEEFRELIQRWSIEYAELYAAGSR